MYAVIAGRTAMVQALLDAKADVSLQDTGGSTALTLAEQPEHTATAQVLWHQAKQQAVEAEVRAAASAC
jgi:ankyrin repeat protein